MSYHEHRCDDPVSRNAECYLDSELSFAEGLMQRFEADLAQDRIPQNQQTSRFAGSALCAASDRVHTNGNRHSNKFSLLQRRTCLGDEIPNKMPTIMTSKIHTAKYWSRKSRL